MPKNRLDSLFQSKQKILSIYFTAGYPRFADTVPLCKCLQKAGVDLIELGFPFSDPLADGPIIQRSSEAALKNGMSLEALFKQLENVRQEISLPLILMGYLNPFIQFGPARFCEKCRQHGIDGVIIPDLPVPEFLEHYRQVFHANNLHFILMVTPQTAPERIRFIDSHSTSFIYAVSSSAVTGGKLQIDQTREDYFRQLRDLTLTHPVLVGFGISSRSSFKKASTYLRGAIIGSAFIEALRSAKDPVRAAECFIGKIIHSTVKL